MITIRVVEQMFVFDSKFWSGRIQDRTRKRQSQDKTGLTPVNTGKVTWPRRLARTKWHRRRERLWRQLRRECWRDTGGAHQWGGGNHRGGEKQSRTGTGGRKWTRQTGQVTKTTKDCAVTDRSISDRHQQIVCSDSMTNKRMKSAAFQCPLKGQLFESNNRWC